MIRLLALLLVVSSLSGCVSPDRNGEGPFRVAEIVPGCRVLFFGDEIVQRPAQKWAFTYAVGKCPEAVRELELGLTKAVSIEALGSTARILITDKSGSRTMTVRRSAFPYGKERFSFIAYWPNGNPFL
ncbi:hypothetical protein [Pseudorhizobium pelagicum]|uniref:hypothetical protein n=1 Tax=Pseudorhizobium pelagicum TaxID=1509405 RepID=UPI0011113550|nr:hypothetical protein [Pseudorhizobium pelagicum]MDY6960555.1 hypothetical protein [Pseudomonadota bacterium]